MLRLPFRVAAWVLGTIGLVATLTPSVLTAYAIASGDRTSGALQRLASMLGAAAMFAVILYAAWSGNDPYRGWTADSDGYLTRKHVVAFFIMLSVWSLLAYAVHRYPHSTTLVWLFWLSVIGPFLPRWILLIVSISRAALGRR